MIRKATGYIILLLALAIFIISSVDDLTRIPAQAKYNTESLWGSDKYRYGDLYGMSYLPQFRKPTQKAGVPPTQPCRYNGRPYHIYAISDSYTWDIFKHPEALCGATESGFAASNYRDILPVKLDTSVNNVVVIETNERNVRTLLADTGYLLRAIHPVKPGEDTSALPTISHRKHFHFDFKMKDADANFEFNLWDYRFLTPIKELKAHITQKWFNRNNNDVAVSPDGKMLFYTPTIDTATTESSFKPVNDREIAQLANGLNAVYNHYKHLGFNRVYLAIIPNPVTVLAPNYKGRTYNGLIPRLQQWPGLKMRVFDSYYLFTNSRQKTRLYSAADTHWTNTGEQFWLEAFNKDLASQ